MDNWFLLYLVTRVIEIKSTADFIAGAGLLIGGIGCVVGFICFPIIMEEAPEGIISGLGKWAKRAGIAWCCVAAISLLLPNRTDLFFIVGGSALIEIVHSDQAKRISSKSLEAVENWLDENMPKKDQPK